MKSMTHCFHSGYGEECFTGSFSERKTLFQPQSLEGNREGFLSMTLSLVEFFSLYVISDLLQHQTEDYQHSLLFLSPVSPCRQHCRDEEMLPPVIQYTQQRSYNRSAIGVTRMFLNATTGRLTHTYNIYVLSKIMMFLSSVYS